MQARRPSSHALVISRTERHAVGIGRPGGARASHSAGLAVVHVPAIDGCCAAPHLAGGWARGRAGWLRRGDYTPRAHLAGKAPPRRVGVRRRRRALKRKVTRQRAARRDDTDGVRVGNDRAAPSDSSSTTGSCRRPRGGVAMLLVFKTWQRTPVGRNTTARQAWAFAGPRACADL